MKTYKHLWDDFVSMDNLRLAAKKAVKNKKNKHAVKKFLEHQDENLQKLQTALINGTYRTSKYNVFKVYEPKEREIFALPLYPDRVVHHAIINILGPIWQKLFIHDSYACIPNKGLHAASARMMHFVRRNKYALQCDIHKFFPSIRHDIIIQILKRKISDKKMLKLLSEIVQSCGGDTNMPIGNLTSQWLGNLYLNQLDYYVKHVLGWHDYIRYCDDFCLLGNDKQELFLSADEIKKFVADELKLRFSKCNLVPTRYGVNFIGYRHFPRFVLLRRRGKNKIRKRMFLILKYQDNSFRAVSQIAAALGWMKWACSFNFKQRLRLDVCVM